MRLGDVVGKRALHPFLKNTTMKKEEIKKEIEATRKRLQDLERKLDEPEEKSWGEVEEEYISDAGVFEGWGASHSKDNPLADDFAALSKINYYVHGGEFYEFSEGDRNYYLYQVLSAVCTSISCSQPRFGAVYFHPEKIEQAKRLFKQYLETKNE